MQEKFFEVKTNLPPNPTQVRVLEGILIRQTVAERTVDAGREKHGGWRKSIMRNQARVPKEAGGCHKKGQISSVQC